MSVDSSDDSEIKPFFYAGVPDPCDKCRFTTCSSFSLHTSTTSNCPYKLCPECRELEALDVQIAEAHNVLVKLSQKRHKLKGRINRRHDRWTSRLPLEIISEIFSLVERDGDYYRIYLSNIWNPLVKIGSVCRRWRDIILDMPQLWTKVIIEPWKHASLPEIMEEWLSRSRALPLSLHFDMIKDKHRIKEPLPKYSNIFQLLRSKATRWKDLKLSLSMKMIQSLLNGLEDRAPVDSLEIHLIGEDRFADRFELGVDDIAMKYPFVPKTLHIAFTPVPLLLVHWDRLTHLTAIYIKVDELLHIFRSAQNLRHCTLEVLPEETEYYARPVSPSTNKSVTSLSSAKMTAFIVEPVHFLRHLTLPSLESLSYAVTYTAHREELDVLVDFLDRSQSPLNEFDLSFYDKSLPVSPANTANTDWYPNLTSITPLCLVISPDDEGERLQTYIQGLKVDLMPMAFPCLQALTISAPMMNPETWDAVAEVFPDGESDIQNALPVAQRPLKTVTILIEYSSEDREILRQSTFHRLCDIRESGVELVVWDTSDENVILDRLLTMDRLTFCESDEDDGDGRSIENSRSEEE